MQPDELIHLFAEHDYLLDPGVVSHLMSHDPFEIRELFDKYAPEILVVSLPGIYFLRKFEIFSKIITLSIQDLKTQSLKSDINKTKEF